MKHGFNPFLGHFHLLFYLRNEFDFWILRVSCQVSEAYLEGFTLALQETQSIHDSMNLPKIEFIALYLHFIINN